MHKFEKIDKSEMQSIFSKVYDITCPMVQDGGLAFRLDGVAGLWVATFYRLDVEVARGKAQSAVEAMRRAIKELQ